MKRFHLFLKTLLFPIGKLLFPCKVMDKDNYRTYDRGRVVISNHLSWIDICYQLFSIPGYKRILSKKENGQNKFVHWLFRSIGVLFVNREKPELSSMRECLGSLNNGETLCIYPEGTRNRVDRTIQPLHSGAAMFAVKGAATVVPVVVHHKGKLFRRNYLGVGDSIDLTDLYRKRIDESVLAEATARFKAGMEKTLEKLDEWVAAKGWRRDKKTKRAEKRALEKQYAAARKTAKRAKRSNG